MMDVDAMAARMVEFNARADIDEMSPLRRELEMMKAAWGLRPLMEFMLQHGRDYQTGPDTFAGPRGKVHGCYRNATLLVCEAELYGRALTYVEGKVLTCGISIDHAWCIDADGVVIDPTLDAERPDFATVGGYFGVPFRTDYVRKAALANKFYGLLDIMSAPKTLPQLIELGLEAGQQWLLDQKKPLRRKRKAG
jgi:hypothetical protein